MRERSKKQDALLPVRLEVRDLRLVVSIAAEGSLTQAGVRLNVTQPALSRHLGILERRIGVRLFIRTGIRMRATPAGELLLRHARDVLDRVAVTETALRELQDTPRRVVRVGTDCYFGYHWLPGVINRHATRHGAVEIEIAFEVAGDPIKSLRAGTIDVALVTDDTAASKRKGFAAVRLFADEFIAVVAPSHPLATRTFIEPNDLKGERLLLLSSAESSSVMCRFVTPSRVKPALVADVQLIGAVAALAESGFGIGIVPNWAIAPEVHSGRLVPLRIGRNGFKRVWAAVVARSDGRAQWLQDFVHSIVTSAPAATLQPLVSGK